MSREDVYGKRRVSMQYKRRLFTAKTTRTFKYSLLATLASLEENTMVRHHSSIAVHCMLLLGIVSLHFVSAKTLSAGSQCGGTVNGTCEDGLVCVPEIPGSVINVCRGIIT